MTDVNVPGQLPALMIGQTPVQPPLGASGGSKATPTTGELGLAEEVGATEAQPGLFGPDMMTILILFVVLMFGMTFFTSRKEKKRRKEMLSSINKKASVQTIGGIRGSVVEVKDDLVVLEVDKSSNTKMTFSRSAIQQVFDAGDGDANS